MHTALAADKSVWYGSGGYAAIALNTSCAIAASSMGSSFGALATTGVTHLGQNYLARRVGDCVREGALEAGSLEHVLAHAAVACCMETFRQAAASGSFFDLQAESNQAILGSAIGAAGGILLTHYLPAPDRQDPTSAQAQLNVLTNLIGLVGNAVALECASGAITGSQIAIENNCLRSRQYEALLKTAGAIDQLSSEVARAEQAESLRKAIEDVLFKLHLKGTFSLAEVEGLGPLALMELYGLSSTEAVMIALEARIEGEIREKIRETELVEAYKASAKEQEAHKVNEALFTTGALSGSNRGIVEKAVQNALDRTAAENMYKVFCALENHEEDIASTGDLTLTHQGLIKKIELCDNRITELEKEVDQTEEKHKARLAALEEASKNPKIPLHIRLDAPHMIEQCAQSFKEELARKETALYEAMEERDNLVIDSRVFARLGTEAEQKTWEANRPLLDRIRNEKEVLNIQTEGPKRDELRQHFDGLAWYNIEIELQGALQKQAEGDEAPLKEVLKTLKAYNAFQSHCNAKFRNSPGKVVPQDLLDKLERIESNTAFFKQMGRTALTSAGFSMALGVVSWAPLPIIAIPARVISAARYAALLGMSYTIYQDVVKPIYQYRNNECTGEELAQSLALFGVAGGTPKLMKGVKGVLSGGKDSVSALWARSRHTRFLPNPAYVAETVTRQECGVRYGGCLKAQGITVEDWFARRFPHLHRLAVNFKTFDFHDETKKIAISVKTLDTQTKARLRKPKQIYYTMKRAIDQAEVFKQSKLGEDFLNPSKILSREVWFGVQDQTTGKQWLAIEKAIAYAKKSGVTVKIIRIT